MSDFTECPWHHQLDKAAYAAQALVSFLDQKQAFAAPLVRTIFQYRSGFAFTLPSPSFDAPQLDQTKANWLSAVFAKIAQRGLPAPCSLKIERYILKYAQSVDVLDYQEETNGGAYQFRLNPRLPFKQNFRQFVYATLYPELLVDDENLKKLVQCYLSVSTPLEQDLFNRLQTRLSDPRLALFVIPQRRMEHLLLNAFHDAQRPDFSIELPSFYSRYCLRLVLEADDLTHQEINQKQIDERRDARLIESGWQVKRFCTFREGQWDECLDQIAVLIHQVITPDLQDTAHQLRSLPLEQKIAIQNLVTLPVIEAQLSIAVARFIREYGTAQLAISDPLKTGLAPVVEAVNENLQLLVKLTKLEDVGEVHFVDEQTATPHLSVFSTLTEAQWGTYSIQQGRLGPCVMQHEWIASLWSAKPQPLHVDMTDDHHRLTMDHLLAGLFRKVQFREGQLAILTRALSLRPVVGLLPTGAGKSLCYQLASLLQPGFSLVIDPLRSLMQDQRNALQEIGIHRCQAIMSGSNQDIKKQDIKKLLQFISTGKYWFIFLSPERLQVQSFLNILNEVFYSLPAVYCVIDEAHCVSEWGHDFRPSYLNVGQRIRKYCIHDEIQPSILALTGTASRNVLTDILKELQIDDQTAIVEPKSFDRKELQFEVISVSNNNRIPRLLSRVRAHFFEVNSVSGIVFTYFKNSVSVSVERITNELKNRLNGQLVCGYRGDDIEIKAIQKQFKLDQIPVLVCTHGFGMGIDKPNVRFVVHAMLPRSLEDYYQQAGRAGRDQKNAKCTILFVDEDENRLNQLLSVPPEDINDLIKGIPDSSRSDLVRNLWFITNSFIGRVTEKNIFCHVVAQLNFSDTRSHKEIIPKFPENLLPNGSKPKINFEKALYRLSLLGVVKDYTIRGSINNPLFQIEIDTNSANKSVYAHLDKYIRKYLLEAEIPKFLPNPLADDFPSSLIQCGEKLIDFVYEFIEKRRRSALGTMLQVARAGATQGPEEFRRQLLAFLEESEFTEPVRSLSSRLDSSEWFSLLAKIKGADDITKLLGACRRQLQETPDHPGLLLLSGLCSLNSPYPEEGRRLIALSFGGLCGRFDKLDRIKVAKDLQIHSKKIFSSSSKKQSTILSAMLIGDTCSDMLDFCYREAELFSEAHHTAVRLAATRILQITTKAS